MKKFKEFILVYVSPLAFFYLLACYYHLGWLNLLGEDERVSRAAVILFVVLWIPVAFVSYVARKRK